MIEHSKKLSIVVPVYNERDNIPVFHAEMDKISKELAYNLELIFVNDGSTDDSDKQIELLSKNDPRVSYIEFSRNFGKEVATTAGLHAAQGQAAIIIDADLQHPIECIPLFIKAWEDGYEIVVGVRKDSKSDSFVKRMGSKLFYGIMSRISETEFIPKATDFRLLDRIVIDEFNRLTERDRITRGLIDWLGFKRGLIEFEAKERLHGTARYSYLKLTKLAFASFISHSFFPLRLGGYLGVCITIISFILGIVMFLDRYFRFWGLGFSGPAILANMILFLVGILLMSIALLSFYISHIYLESQNRPMYVIRKKIINTNDRKF